MQSNLDIKNGWDFAAKLAGVNFSNDEAEQYIQKVEEAIHQLEMGINEHPYRNLGEAQFQGYVQESWHENTFNIDAIAHESMDRAKALGSTDKWSVDLKLESGKEYSAKSYATPEKSGMAQAILNQETGRAGYDGQGRLVPSDHLSGARDEMHKRSIQNMLTRENVAKAYSETEKQLTDRLQNEEGIESRPVTRKELNAMAQEAKKGQFSAEKHGVSLASAINQEELIKHALQAGCTAATITAILQVTPDIYKAIDYLIKTGEIDLKQVKKIGEKALSSSSEGFIRGSVSCSLLIMCEQGAFGEALKGISPTMVGTIVSITMGTIKNSLLVASGKMTKKQMGSAFVDSLVVSAGFIAGAKIGGMIGQAIGAELPVIGYLLGSMIGCAFSVTYNIGKKHLISLCVDTGFTCFGLVEQDYMLPDELLEEMGIEVIQIPTAEIETTELEVVPISNDIECTDYETVEIKMIGRGLIGLNKVGYTFS